MKTPHPVKSPSKKTPLRIGIIGCGRVSSNHALGYRQNAGCQITQVFDLNRPAAEKLALETGASVADSMEAMAAEGSVDAVSICTPPVAHTECCLTFLKAGIPVLCEKPLEMNAARAAKLAAAAKKTGTPFMMAFTQRFYPPIIEARKILRKGTLGRPLFFRNTFGGEASIVGDHRAARHLSGGGSIADNGTHSVDLFRFLVDEVSAVTAKVAQLKQKTEVEDFSLILLEGQNGTFGEIMSTYSLPVVHNYVQVVCEKGMLSVNYYIAGRPDLTIQKKDKEEEAIPVSMEPFKFTRQIGQFLQCIRKKTPPPVTIEDGLRCAEVVSAAYRSAETRRTITL